MKKMIYHGDVGQILTSVTGRGFHLSIKSFQTYFVYLFDLILTSGAD